MGSMFRLVAAAALFLCSGCITTYYEEASDGLVGCDTSDMIISEGKAFGTRTWIVTCPGGKRWECAGTLGYANCKQIDPAKRNSRGQLPDGIPEVPDAPDAPSLPDAPDAPEGPKAPEAPSLP